MEEQAYQFRDDSDERIDRKSMEEWAAKLVNAKKSRDGKNRRKSNGND